MRSFSWLPLRYIIRKAAKSQGFLDPIEIMARLRGLAQPSEVEEPIELLRAGVVFHARGLINSKVIQHNLDWIWPYWVQRQYDPRDIAFIPRAFSVTHINLTHRNWTAVGYPDFEELPIVDPRGWLTPFLDSWSIDVWVISEDGRQIIPSHLDEVRQDYISEDGLRVKTRSTLDGLSLTSSAAVVNGAAGPVCEYTVDADDQNNKPGWLVIALRPQNPEGVSFINSINLSPDGQTWTINGKHQVLFDQPVKQHHVSDYQDGDVFRNLTQRPESNSVNCGAGLATAAAVFDLRETSSVKLSIPLATEDNTMQLADNAWQDERLQACQLRCPDKHYQSLWESAQSSLIIHSPKDVYPGPYTYKRFWFRDAAFIIHALLAAGLEGRARRAIDQFFHRQTVLGYFRSQEGEWDSNGEVLWIIRRYQLMTGLDIPKSWHQPLKKGARWIIRKLLDDNSGEPHAGLMPVGFSAEHLGPNDYYYWDDFWSIAGLQSARDIFKKIDPEASDEFDKAQAKLQLSVDRSLAHCQNRLDRPGMPASPYRRMDAGAIGSIAAGYPLRIFAQDDPRLLDCVEFLLQRCFVDGAFFQDMIHSGLNAYLTLQTAQVLLRAEDPRYLELMDRVAELATSTGQWPEAIHPQTLGGCMGDGHHVWASAEWVLMLRNCFIREEQEGLLLLSGIPARWLKTNADIQFGPTPTEFGTITINLKVVSEGQVQLSWIPRWHGEAPKIDIRLPGYKVTEQSQSDALLVRAEQLEPA